jgi:hypothetical protein
MLINQIQRILISFLFCFLIANIAYAQKTLTSEEAYAQDSELYKVVKEFHYERDFLKWYPIHLQRMDLIPKIKNRHAYVLHFYYSMGWNFRVLEHYRESLKMYNAFLSYYDANEALFSSELKQSYLGSRSFAYRSTAVAYEKLSLMDSARFEHQKDLKYTDTMATIYKPAAINDYGMFLYGGLKNNDLALTTFKEAYALTKTHFPNHFLLGSIRDNMATIYFEKGDFDTAKTLYKDNFEFYKKVPNETSKVVDANLLVKAGAKIVNIEIKQGNLKQAAQAYSQLENAFNTYSHLPVKKQETRLKFLKSKQQFLEVTQKLDEAYEALKIVNRLSDSMNQANASKSKERIAAINEFVLDRSRDTFKIEKAQKENQISNQRLKLWVISITALFLVLLLTSLYLRRRQHSVIARNKQVLAEQDLKLTALKNEHLNSELKSKQRDLSDFAINLTQNQEWAKALANKLKQLKTATGRERKTLLENLEQDIHSKIQFDNNTKDFYERLDRLSDSFYKVLHSKYPNLSKTEIRLCSLIRLKIESHAIANLQNITLSSLNTSRYRLRKKLNLTEEDNLDEFIQFL